VDVRTGNATLLLNGDRLRVPSMAENMKSVLVVGAVFGAPVTLDKPTPIPVIPVSVQVPYVQGLTLLNVLEGLGGPTPYAKASESAVIKAATGQRVLVDVESLWATRNRGSDVSLEPGDTVSIPMVYDVFVAGEVRVQGKVPYSPAFTVADYLTASGGVKPDSGDVNAVFFVDKFGNRTPAGMGDSVKPGTIIFADKNWWFQTQQGLTNTLIIVGFASAVIGLTADILALIP
jgi:polysaccharide export outer membrane protein